MKRNWKVINCEYGGCKFDFNKDKWLSYGNACVTVIDRQRTEKTIEVTSYDRQKNTSQKKSWYFPINIYLFVINKYLYLIIFFTKPISLSKI